MVDLSSYPQDRNLLSIKDYFITTLKSSQSLSYSQVFEFDGGIPAKEEKFKVRCYECQGS